MSHINDLQEKRAKLITEAQTVLLASPDDEKRASAQKMLADVDKMEQDITALKKIDELRKADETRMEEERRATLPNRGEIENTATNGLSQKDKDVRDFSHYVRTGEIRESVRFKGASGAPAEVRDINTTTGAALIPQSMYGILTDALKSFGNVVQYCTMINTPTGEPLKIASDSDVSNLLGLIAEDTGVSEADPTINSATVLESDFLTTGVVKVSLMQLRQANFDVESWIRKSFGVRYYRGLASMVTNGNGSNFASMKTSAHTGATTASPTAIAWADIAATYASLDPAYEPQAVWSFNSFTRGVLLSTVDTLGRPLYTVNQMASKVAGGFVDSILGHEVVISQFMDNANTATNIPILFGDHSAYHIRMVDPGLEIYRLQELYIASGEIGFIGYAMGGGTLVDAGTHPLVSLVQHS